MKLWMTFAQDLAICSPGPRRCCVTSRDRQALYPGIYRPCIQILQIQSISDIDPPLLLSTTTALYEEGNTCNGCVVEDTSAVKAWRKDNKAVPRIFHDHELRTLYIQSSSPRCTATPPAKHVKNLGSLIWRLGESATISSWTGPSEQYQYLCETLEASDVNSMSTAAFTSSDYHVKDPLFMVRTYIQFGCDEIEICG